MNRSMGNAKASTSLGNPCQRQHLLRKFASLKIPVQQRQLDRPEWPLFRATAKDSDAIGKILWKLSFRSFLRQLSFVNFLNHEGGCILEEIRRRYVAYNIYDKIHRVSIENMIKYKTFSNIPYSMLLAAEVSAEIYSCISTEITLIRYFEIFW